MASTVSSTTLSVGLITAPISLKKAKDDDDVSFGLASQNGEKVKQVYVVEDTGEVVGTRADCARGIWDGEAFHPVDPDTIKAINESVVIEGIAVEGFIPLSEVPFERAEACYFVAPGKAAGSAGAKALRLLRDGLTKTGQAGIGKLTLRTKQRAFVIYEENGALLVSTLAFANTFGATEEAREVLGAEQTDEKTLGLFEQLVAAQAASRSDLDGYVDDATAKKAELVEAALAGKTIVAPAAAPKADTTIDLAAALEASIAATPKAKTKVA